MRDFQKPGRSMVFAGNGMVATSHPLAAKTALGILEDGGNAVDAAIAGAILLGFCEPQMTGIGGDLFALIDNNDGTPIIALNGSGRSPQGLTADLMRADGETKMPLHSPHSVTIPGAVDAFCKLSADHGALDLATVLEPSIRYARDGIPVAPKVAFDWNNSVADLHPSALGPYAFNGVAPAVGQIFSAPEQAIVLEKIATHGRAGYYEGEVAEDIVQSLNALGGTHHMDDLAGVSCDYGEAIQTTYGSTQIFEHPPNGQGATALLLLNILSNFDHKGLDPFGVERTHIEAEATKLAYDARDRILADPDHMARLEFMLSPETAKKLAALISTKSAIQDLRPTADNVHKDTVYICVVDKNGQKVSLIYSIFHAFGSGIATNKFGILMQNRGAGFTLEPGHPNELAPGKRPMHTIIPGMLGRDGKVIGPFGVMGGAYQPNGHARFVSNMDDFGMDAQTAIDAPRSFAENGLLKLEQGYSANVADGLAALGHKIEISKTPIGGAQSIFEDGNGVLRGASDPRKDGCALGY